MQETVTRWVKMMERPFKQYKFEDCERFSDDGRNPYYEGFIDGCMDADNSRETCERFIE
ncbi:MAG: hypothetical protein WBX01_00215 [Nitrososphaeraceae archaeon]